MICCSWGFPVEEEGVGVGEEWMRALSALRWRVFPVEEAGSAWVRNRGAARRVLGDFC